MSVSFSKASNGEEICFWDSKPLHSTYNPSKEAERFVDSIAVKDSPSYIIFLGPCLPFCLPFLRKKYPSSRLIAVQFFNGLPNLKRNWDYEFVFDNVNETAELLYSIIGEENSHSVEIISWASSERLFNHSYAGAYQALKIFLAKARDVLGTRLYFSKRWFTNTVNFFTHVHKICTPASGNVPVLITASGPSLYGIIPRLLSHRQSFYLIALSSSLGILAHYNITPDLIISTDGGFWANTHLSFLAHSFADVPIAISPESSLPLSLFQTRSILPLNYGDDFSSWLFKELHMYSHPALRNGTVSGTALFVAKQLSIGPIFFAGLDLSTCKGHQHTQPNLIEEQNRIHDYKLRSLETRAVNNELQSGGSLLLYEQWFKNLSNTITTNVYRIKPDSYSFKNILGTIQDISFNECLSLCNTHHYKYISIKYTSTADNKHLFANIIKNMYSSVSTSDPDDPSLFDKNAQLSLIAKAAILREFLAFSKHKNTASFRSVRENLISVFYKLLKNLED